MEPASRTPEGLPNRCPVCGNEITIDPSLPAGDAPCPCCGHLLWFSTALAAFRNDNEYSIKLLRTVVDRGADDLYIVTGQPPVVRLHGKMVRLETKPLAADDCVALMKSITPERNQHELQENGGTDFGFAFGEQARFRVAVFKQRGRIGMVLRRFQAAP
jgi:hypothetical protein